jgi:hypothetical protein
MLAQSTISPTQPSETYRRVQREIEECRESGILRTKTDIQNGIGVSASYINRFAELRELYEEVRQEIEAKNRARKPECDRAAVLQIWVSRRPGIPFEELAALVFSGKSPEVRKKLLRKLVAAQKNLEICTGDRVFPRGVKQPNSQPAQARKSGGLKTWTDPALATWVPPVDLSKLAKEKKRQLHGVPKVPGHSYGHGYATPKSPEAVPIRRAQKEGKP